MALAVWAATVLLAVVFLGSGAFKLTKSRQAMAEAGMIYVRDLPAWSLKLIGLAELAGAIGLVLPPVLDRNLELVAAAAGLLAVLMLAAVGLHVRRSEPFLVPLCLMLLAGAVAVLRLTVYPL
ncbi:DoxX family protein [Georgenia sunbinii]|uniref:DoxX family protein n=1 Tax=Georgenia sunbinii TaxID=3117728 RepID=UPI002F262903